MKQWYCACMALFVVEAALLAEAVRTEAKEGKERVIVLENEHLKVVLFPDLGGRIGHLIDKKDGDDLLYWDLSHTAIYHGEGGALDDRRNTFEPYQVAPPRKGDPPASARLVFEGSGAAIQKMIALRDGRSTVQIDYLYQNKSQRDFTEYQVMTKNWFFPSGGVITPSDVYCLPTSRGVRRMLGFSGSWGKYPELRSKFKQDVGSWNGIASKTKNRGLVTAFSNDYYRWFYYWKGGVEVPTYEWVFHELPAGQQAAISLWIHVVRGMSGFSHANRRVAADVQYEESGKLHTKLFAAEEALTSARVETEIRRLPDGLPVRIGELDFGALSLATTAEKPLSWKAPEPGTYVIRQRVLDGRTILAEYDEAIEVGKPSGELVRPNHFPAQRKFTRVPGWKKIPVADVVRPADEDRKRGYLAYFDEFGDDAVRGKAAAAYGIHLGKGEIKSFAFKVRALEALKSLSVSVEPMSLKADQIEVFGIERINVGDPKAGKADKWGEKLVPLAAGDLGAGEDRTVWVRVRTGRDDSGQGAFHLVIKAEGREPQRIEITVEVHAVSLPRPNLISMEVEHSTMILPGCWNHEEGRWNTEVIERYTRDLGEHLADFEQGFWGWFGGPRDNLMLNVGDGQDLREYLKKNPDLAEPPVLDFSYLNPVFDAAIRNGMVRFSTNSGGALPPKTPLGGWVMKEAARYLRDRGYPSADIWCKNRDEQPSTNYPAMVKEVQWLRQHGYRPYSTFNNLLTVKEHMSILNPAFDLFQGGYTTAADLAERLEDGTLDRDDEVWMYQGWGATWIPYERNRRPGWFAAATGLDGYHVHVYYRWHKLDAIIFPSPEGPSGSPAWEGMRDGMSDAQYVALARRWIARLERASGKNAALRAVAKSAQAKLSRVVGTADSLIPTVRKRSRLVWVERVDELAIPTAEKAREQVLGILDELQPLVAKLGPSLYYGSHVLAEEGQVKLHLSSGADQANAKLLSTLCKDAFGVVPRSDAPATDSFVVDLQAGKVPASWAATGPHVAEKYPGAGEYVIHVVPAKADAPTRMLIFGRDEAGLEKGLRHWLSFLRTERRGVPR